MYRFKKSSKKNPRPTGVLKSSIRETFCKLLIFCLLSIFAHSSTTKLLNRALVHNKNDDLKNKHVPVF